MRASKITIFTILLIFLNAYATHEIILAVCQPIFSSNGISDSYTSYSKSLNYSISAKMMLTCERNCILEDERQTIWNLANIYGFRVEFSRTEPDMYINSGDTITLNLSVPEKFDISKAYLEEVSPEQTLKATIICLYKNAISYHFINNLDIQIVGNLNYLKYSNVYNKENIFSFKDI